MSESKPVILTIGSINYDLIFHCSHLAKPGETLGANRVAQSPGGKGANQAVAAARLGARSILLGCLGQDQFGDEIRKSLAAAGVDISHVTTSSSKGTGIASIQVNRDGENSIVLYSGANADLTNRFIDQNAHLIAAADALLIQLEIPITAVETALKHALKHNVPVIFDPAPVPADGVPLSLLKADFFTPNQSELFALTGAKVRNAEQARAAMASLQEQGAGTVITKLGANGACLLDPQGTLIESPSFPVVPVDTTGAGDAFNAAFAIATCRKSSAEDALRYACAAGALAATKTGALPAMPFHDDVENLILVNS